MMSVKQRLIIVEKNINDLIDDHQMPLFDSETIIHVSTQSSLLYKMNRDTRVTESVHETLVIHVAEHATVQCTILIRGVGKYSLKVLLVMLGEHAHVVITVIYTLHERASFVFASKQEHLVGKNYSAILVRGILDDVAKAHTDFLIMIAKEAIHTQAYQESKTLLLSSNAQIIAKPALEILNNQIQCRHGVAVSRIDLAILLYMQMRGLYFDDAKKLFTNAFIVF
jgi:Fe-S cluster assembly protein SufD